MAAAAQMLPNVPTQDLAYIMEWVAGTAMLITASGVVGQRLLARRSIGLKKLKKNRIKKKIKQR